MEEFFRRNRDVYFITFTEPGRPDGVYWTKDEAEKHFKPFRDLCARRRVELIVVWEKQQRGAWHPHCLVNQYFDVNTLRPWMVERGWGQIMRLEWVTRHRASVWAQPHAAQMEHCHMGRIMRYLSKYLCKSLHDPEARFADKSKVFGASRSAKAGGTSFRWAPWVRAGSMLWYYGQEFFVLFHGRQPRFLDSMEVIRLGVEATDWASCDPLWEFGFKFG